MAVLMKSSVFLSLSRSEKPLKMCPDCRRSASAKALRMDACDVHKGCRIPSEILSVKNVRTCPTKD